MPHREIPREFRPPRIGRRLPGPVREQEIVELESTLATPDEQEPPFVVSARRERLDQLKKDRREAAGGG